MRKRLRIFISSPGDVNEERVRAHLVIQKLARDYARFLQIEAYLWEHEPMLASGHFQDAIEPPSATDIVVLIVYARLGTALPEKTATREYRGIDGRAPVTGTEWEFEDALAAHRAKGVPDLLAYRKAGDPGLSLTDPLRRAQQEQQWAGLEAFWRRHFEDAGMFLAGSSRFATVEEFDKKLEADLTALIERRIAQDMGGEPHAADAPKWLKGSPFRGLSAYGFEDADIFFGRDAQTRLALTRLQAASEHGCAFLLLLGASGSGKSSLARAGVLPALFVPKAIPGIGVWRRVVFRPADGGDDPIRRFAVALVAGDPASGFGLPEILGAGVSVDALATHLTASADDPTYPFRLALEKVAADGRATRRMLPHESARLVILVDQLEELFTRGIAAEKRNQFLRILSALARSGLAWVVATMRSDLWHRAAEAKILLELVEAGARLDLPRPEGAEIIEIIRRPAAAAGIRFDVDAESGVALDAVIAPAAAAEPGVLPLLSVLLDTLYERDIASPSARAHTLTFQSYRALGELKGAIAQRADAALARLRETDREAADALPRVLRALVTVSQSGDAVTARPARLDAFSEGGPEARLINAFLAADARLLVASARDDGAEVRLAHESLIENWPAAREQVQRDRRDLETRARLEALHRRWRDAPSAPEKKRALISGLNLAEGSDLVARWLIDRSAGLGEFVQVSERVDRLRRGRFAGIAAGLALVFAAIAGFALVESERAEREASSARAAEQAERTARQATDEQRAEAERQRDRADEARREAESSEKRTKAALRATQKQAARTLAGQADSAAARNELRRALAYAIEAAETEGPALDPGEPSASEPALLRAMANTRQVLHIRKNEGGPSMPYAWLSDTRLVHADAAAGVIVTDLSGAPTVAARGALPEGMRPMHLAAASLNGVIAVAGGSRLALIDAGSGVMRKTFSLPARVTGLDVHPSSNRLAIATTGGLAIIDLANATMGDVVPVEVGNSAVGQVRFAPSGERLYFTVGTQVRVYDLVAQRFLEEPQGQLQADAAGLDKTTLEGLLSKALITVVELLPDPTRDRLLQWHVYGISERRPGAVPRAFEREDPALRVLGISFTDSRRSGAANEAVVVLARNAGDTGEEIQLRFVSDEPKMHVFERFTVAADDATGDKLADCKVSLNLTQLACRYSTRVQEGLIVYRLQGGQHRFERVLGSSGMRWGGFVSTDGAVLFANDTSLYRLNDRMPEKIETLPAGFSPTTIDGDLLGAISAGGQAGVWRLDAAEKKLTTLVPPTKAGFLALSAASQRAVIAESDRLAIHDLADGRRIASVPGLDGVRALALSADGARLNVLTESSLFGFDARRGRLLTSHPLIYKLVAAAFDKDGRRLAMVDDKGTLRLVELDNGAAQIVMGSLPPISVLAFPSDDVILFGRRDGGVQAIGPDGKPHWEIPTPLGRAFSEGTAWPGQPPKGLVRALALSPDAKRLAVLRQDMPAVDLHEAATGRFLTQISTPWSWGVPSRVSLGPAGAVLTTFALHPMAFDKPAHVALHVIPLGLDPALATAREHLARIDTVRAPDLAPRNERRAER